MSANLAIDVERRKKVRVHIRSDLDITQQKYEGRTYYVVKDPVSLRYWRFRDWEHFLIRLMDGKTTLDEAQKLYEQRFRPERLRLEELEAFAQQLISAGLAINDSTQVGQQLFKQRSKRRRSEWVQALTNILYIKIPVFDPERVLVWMLRYLSWMFTTWFLVVSLLVMLSAIMLVLTHFDIFRSRLPAYQEFFSLHNLLYMWLALGVVKVIHEFGHGLSCRAFGGEVHEMGALFLCLSPCLYCNVSDSWTLPNKWHRIIISAAGIWVELIIAAIATFIWWNSTSDEWISQISMSLMIVCSISTVVFNANPLMRYDGYYVLADWIEIPNLRERCNRYLMRLVQEHCLGMENLPPEPYMERWRRILFLFYAIVSYIYRWVVTFGILWFFYMFLKPYKLGAVGGLLAMGALASMIGWPLYRLGKNLYKRGRLPDMKTWRVTLTALTVGLVVVLFFTVPLPVSRVRQTALVEVHPDAASKVHVSVPGVGDRTPGILKRLEIKDGQSVPEDYILAEFRNLSLEMEHEEAVAQEKILTGTLREYEDQLREVRDDVDRGRIQSEIAKTKGERDRQFEKARATEKMLDNLVLRAPSAGVVMSPPSVDEVGKQWDKDRTTPFCSIGNPRKLRVLMPVSTSDYDLLKADRRQAERKGRDLDVDIRIHGRAGKVWKGKIALLPESEARDIPPSLTAKAGGPVTVKPGQQPNTFVPTSQQYLVAIDILNPDDAICPGTLAQVKVHCEWRSGAWWVWRTISQMFDLGLM